MDAYQERVSYDANGNILTYLRKGEATNLNMDDLTYHYNLDGQGRLLNNRLDHVSDAVTATQHAEDIDDQSAANYTYDEIGNLTSDVKENISAITWTVYGKIASITKTNDPSGVSSINYTYDASGNRISKAVTKTNGTIATTWYVRDASGNVMATYSASGSSTSGPETHSLVLSEQHIYGSSRLGILSRNVDMKTAYIPSLTVDFIRGFKSYELSNHLGNVLVTISDKRVGHDADNGNYDYFESDVVTANDYYPFGMMMPGRKYEPNKYYRYGFNSHEKDDEVIGQSVHYSFGDYGYDPRTARRWNIDPVVKNYESSYCSFANNPIWLTDHDGRDTTLPAASDGNNITLPTGATFTTYQNEKYVVKGTNIPVNVQPGQLRSFTIDGNTYSAIWNTKDGSFVGYQDDHGNSVVQTHRYKPSWYDQNHSYFTLGMASLTYNSTVRVNSYLNPLNETRLALEAGIISKNSASIRRFFFLKNSRLQLDPLGDIFSSGVKTESKAVSQVERFISNPASDAYKIFKTNKYFSGTARFFKVAGPVLTVATEGFTYYTIITKKPDFEQVKDMYDNYGNPIYKFYRNVIEKPLFKKIGIE